MIALRADFYGRALEYPELARAAQEAQVVVGPMDDTDLRAAVVEPARKAGVTIEDGLVEVLLADVHRPGSAVRCRRPAAPAVARVAGDVAAG